MFLFTMFSDLGDIIQRGREHEPLTPGEAALLRLFDGLTVAALLAGWAAFQEYGPHIPALTGAAGAVFAALGLAWQQWAAHGGLAAVTGTTVTLAPAQVGVAAVPTVVPTDVPEMPPMPDGPVAQASGGVDIPDLVPVGAWGSPGVPRTLPLTDASLPVRGPLPPMAPAPLTANMRARLFHMDPNDSGFLLDSQPTPAAHGAARGTLADMPAGGLVRDPADLDISMTGPVPAVTAPTMPAMPAMPEKPADGPLSRATKPVPAVGADEAS